MGVSPSKPVEEVSADDIADFVLTLGSAFSQYEDLVRTSGMTGTELANLDEDCLNVVLDSLRITSRLHRRKLVSVCRKQLQSDNNNHNASGNDQGSVMSNHHGSGYFSFHNGSRASGIDFDNRSVASGSTCSTRTPPPPPSAVLLNMQPPAFSRNTSLNSVGSVATTGTAGTAGTNRSQSRKSVSRMASFDGSFVGEPIKKPMSGALENMCVSGAQEALALIANMENQKRMLRKEDRPSGPPTQEATIVLTDVQGSTTLWEADAIAMRHALNLHDEMIRELRAEHGGYEIDTEGDAFFLAFHTANDALGFALNLQERLREADWDDDILCYSDAAVCETTHNRGLRVRMGIHMGAVKTSQNAVTGRLEYTGPTMDRARVIEGMAEGGQILASTQTYEAASMPVQTKNLTGEHQNSGVIQVLCAERRSARRRTSVSSHMSLSGAGSNHTLTSVASRRRPRRNSSNSSLLSINSMDSSDESGSTRRGSQKSVASGRRRGGRKPSRRSTTLPVDVEKPKTVSAKQRLAQMC